MNKDLSKKKEYILGIDLLKVIAIILVISVHFFYNTNFYHTDINNISMKLQLILRNFCMSCVPLFIIITGYLNNQKDYNKKFFKGLLNIIIIWLFYSIIELIVLSIINNDLSNLTIGKIIYKITSFKACHYSWYIEMYICLYIITPILNRAFDSFNNKSKIVSTLLIITFTIVFVYINEVFDGFIHLPEYWNKMYIIAYYYVGKCISHFKPNFNKKFLLFLLVFNILTSSILLIINGVTLNYNSVLIFTQTVLLFLILYNINSNNKIFKKIIRYISNITLDVYLASSLIDIIVYKYLYIILGNISQFKIIIYFPIVTLLAFILSIIYALIRKLFIKIR